MLCLAAAPPLGLQNTTGCTCTTAGAVPSQASSRSTPEPLAADCTFPRCYESRSEYNQTPSSSHCGSGVIFKHECYVHLWLEVPLALVIYRKGCCKHSFWRQTRSQKTKVKPKQCFPLSEPPQSDAGRRRACISRYPASRLKEEGIHKSSRHSSRLGTQDHFHSLGNSFVSTPTNWPWQNMESLHVTAMFVLWVIQYSKLMLHFVGETNILLSCG